MSSPKPEPDGVEISLAEYSALRSEIDRRAGTQWNVFALQIGSAGAIASLAIASSGRIALLLLVPAASYMLGSRYILHDFHIKLISDYITTDLSPRLGGVLRWEGWKHDALAERTNSGRWLTVDGWNPVHPTRLAFLGPAVLALLASIGNGVYLWTTSDAPRWWVAAGYAAACLLDATLIGFLNRAFTKAG
jgi:hypothetical protein